MFTLKWNEYYSGYSVTFDDGWKRLNHCSAATYRTVSYSSENALQREVKTEKYYLVSYASPIIYVERKYYVDNGQIICTQIHVNEVQWNCSHTTIQHISRFCRNLDFFYGIDVSYHDIKQAMLSTALHYGFTTTIKDRMTITRETPYEMKSVFTAECPIFR